MQLHGSGPQPSVRPLVLPPATAGIPHSASREDELPHGASSRLELLAWGSEAGKQACGPPQALRLRGRPAI